MRKFLLSALAVALSVFTLTAQDGEKALKDATKALNSYKLDNEANKSKLAEAREAIEIAVANAPSNATAKAWLTKGEIYNAAANADMTAKLLDPNAPTTAENAGMEAFTAFKKAMELASKKFETKDALKGLAESFSHLSNLGVAKYESGEYEGAYSAFNAGLEIHEILKANGEKSSLDNPDDLNNQSYITGLAALNAGKMDAAKAHFSKLYDMSYDKAMVYDAMYQIKMSEGDEKGALAVLEAARQKYPDEISLLFTEINHYLKANRLEELIGKLKLAIEKEPDNISLYTTMGNVFDNLSSKMREAGDNAKGDEYFNESVKYFQTALEKDPNNVDANYRLGVLFYNNAAALSKELNELANDYSKEGTKKYEIKKQEVFAQFDKALPYFQKAEQYNPNDLNTLIALKEIYAKKDDLATSSEFKKRLENVQAGGKNDKSFFQK